MKKQSQPKNNQKVAAKAPRKLDPLLARALDQNDLANTDALLVLNGELAGRWMDPTTNKAPTRESRSIAFYPNADIGWESNAYAMDADTPCPKRCCDVLPWAGLKAELDRVAVCWPAAKVKDLVDAGGKFAYACEHLRAVARRQQGENYADCDALDSYRWAKAASVALESAGFDPDDVACGYLPAIKEFEESESGKALLAGVELDGDGDAIEDEEAADEQGA